jgi:DNA-binding transcriptional MerR regulator
MTRTQDRGRAARHGTADEAPSVRPALAEALSRRAQTEAFDIPADARLTVAQVCELLDIGQHTLRYYERQGLVHVPRDAAGHREYGPAQLRRVEFLKRMRTSGMSMSRLAQYIALVEQGDDTVPQRLALMREHRESIIARLQEIQVALAATDYKIETYGGMLGDAS